VLDAVPEYVDTECYIERRADGTYVRRCPTSAEVMGFGDPVSAFGNVNINSEVGGVNTSLGANRGGVEDPARVTDAGYPIGYLKYSEGAGELSGKMRPEDAAAAWFKSQRFAAMTFNHGPDYMTNTSAYRKRLPNGSWRWCYPGDEARGLTDAGDILPTIVTADTAKAYIAETDTGYDTLDKTIAGTTVPQEFQTAWKATYVGWKGFAAAANASVGFFTAKAVMDQTDRWVQTLGQFSIQFHALSPSSPVPTMPSPPGQGVPDKSAASLLSGTTGLVLAGAALAAILVLGPRFSKG
jgi:hypothetical protein